MTLASSSKPLRIERATSEAHIRLAAPLFDRYRVFYKQPSDLDASYRFLFDRWVASESVLFLAFDDEGATGFVHLYPIFASAQMKRLWLLNDLYVIEERRRSGTARALLRRAEAHAEETASAGLELSTAVTNLQAQSLYQSEGYIRDTAFFIYNKLFAASTEQRA